MHLSAHIEATSRCATTSNLATQQVEGHRDGAANPQDKYKVAPTKFQICRPADWNLRPTRLATQPKCLIKLKDTKPVTGRCRRARTADKREGGQRCLVLVVHFQSRDLADQLLAGRRCSVKNLLTWAAALVPLMGLDRTLGPEPRQNRKRTKS